MIEIVYYAVGVIAYFLIGVVLSVPVYGATSGPEREAGTKTKQNEIAENLCMATLCLWPILIATLPIIALWYGSKCLRSALKLINEYKEEDK